MLKDWHAAGVTIAVVEKDKVVYTGGFGYRDLETQTARNRKHRIRDWVLHQGLHRFADRHAGSWKLDGDKPVRNYLPELKFQNEYTNDHATLRDMMCHRTGLPRHDLSWYASWAREEFLKRIEFLEPTAELRANGNTITSCFMARV